MRCFGAENTSMRCFFKATHKPSPRGLLPAPPAVRYVRDPGCPRKQTPSQQHVCTSHGARPRAPTVQCKSGSAHRTAMRDPRAANTAATTLRAPGVSWGACTCMTDAKGREPRPCTCCTASVWCVYFLGVHMRCRLCHLHPLSPPASCSPRPDCAQLLRRRRPSQGRHIMWCVRLIHRRYGRCRPLWWL